MQTPAGNPGGLNSLRGLATDFPPAAVLVGAAPFDHL